MANKVTVKSGQTLSQIAKANNTTVKAILADPANKVLAERTAAGTTVLFNGTKVAIPAPPVKSTPPASTDSSASGSGTGTGAGGTGTGGTGTGGEDNPSKWTKAGTVQTANGPVDVDANGVAQDGSVPVAVSGGGNNTPKEITLTSTETDAYGNVVGYYSDGTSKILTPSGNKYRTTVDQDAYAILEQTFKDYGLDELVPVIQGYMDRGIGSNQAALEIRKEPAYQKRFAGNTQRINAGMNVLSEAEYLNLENSYSEILKSYGLGTYLGTDAKTRQKAMADIIGGDVSATEFKDRVDTVVTRVQNADPTIRKTLTSFYGIKDEDLVSYFLNPKDNLPKLQEKVTAAEIGAAATNQGLATSAAAATALAQFGVTKAQAQEGYQAIGAIMPTATKLGEIYGDKYDQATAEAEVFKGTASAQRKRQKLAALEEASFSGSSGVARTGRPQTNTGQF